MGERGHPDDGASVYGEGLPWRTASPLTEAGKTIAVTIASALRNGFSEIEVTKEAEDAWVELLLSGPGRMLGSPDCTPGYSPAAGG
jgi:hypothetical protein